MFIFTSFHLEIPDFLSPEEADHIIDVAEYVGFAKSDIHLDPVAKQHGKTVRSTEGKLQVQPWARAFLLVVVVLLITDIQPWP